MDGQIKQIGYSDQPFQVLNNTFVKEGYEFVCWNTKKDGTGSNIHPNDMFECQFDTTLYAKWKSLYKYMYLIRSGNLNILNNVTTFNDKSFEYTPINVDWTSGNSFEFVFKLTTPKEIANGKQVIFGMQNNNIFNLVLTTNYFITFELTGATSKKILAKDKQYYIKFNKNVSTYTLSLSEDGITYEEMFTTQSSATMIGSPLYIGREYTRSYSEAYTQTSLEPIYSQRLVTKKRKNTLTRDVTKVTGRKYVQTGTTTELIWHTKSGCDYSDENLAKHLDTNKKTEKTIDNYIKSMNKRDDLKDNGFTLTRSSTSFPYEVRLCHVRKVKKQKGANNGCGVWREETVPVYEWVDVEETSKEEYEEEEEYYEWEDVVIDYYEQPHTDIRTAYDYGYTFGGKIDFNESYLVLNNIKYKLKA